MPEIDFAAIIAEDKAQTIAPPADGIPKADAEPDKTAETGAAPGDDAPETPPEAPKPKRTVEERISTLTAKRKEAERRAEKAEAEKQELLDRLTRTVPANDPLDPSKFTSLEERDKAVREQARKEAVAELQAEQMKTKVETFWGQLEAEGKDIDDFDDVLETLQHKGDENEFPISPPMASYLLNRAKNKAPLAKWLVDNRKEAQRIYGLQDPVEVGAEMAERDRLLGRASGKQVTKAPPPPPSVQGASGGTPQTFETMSHEDIKKWAKEQQK